MKKAFLLIILSISLLLICNYKIYASESVILREETGFKIEDSYLTGIEEEREVSSFDLGLDTSYTTVILDKNNTAKTSGYIFTGDKVQVKKGSTKVGEYTVLILGDTNGDGKISSLDYVKIKNHIMGMQISEEVYLKSADYNNDNKINSLDYVKVKKYIMGKSTTKYTITYNANGGSGTMSKQSVTANTTTNLLRNTFTKEGNTSNGWNTKADGSGTTYKDVSKIKVTKNITLYAQWVEDTHTLSIQYNGNGGTWNNPSKDMYAVNSEGTVIVKSTGEIFNARYKYGESLPETGLVDYNGGYMNWSKDGSSVPLGKEYIIDGTNIALDQAKQYTASELADKIKCNLQNKDCSMLIKVNFVLPINISGKTYKTRYNSSSGFAGYPQNFAIANFGTSDETLYISTSETGHVPSTTTDNNKLESIKTTIINKYTVSGKTTTLSDKMYLKSSGHGQPFDYDTNNDVFITNDFATTVTYGTTMYGSSTGLMGVKFSKVNKNGDYDRLFSYNLNIKEPMPIIDNESGIFGRVRGTDVYLYDYDYNSLKKGTFDFSKPKHKFTITRAEPTKYNGTDTISSQGFALYNGFLYEVSGGYGRDAYLEAFDLSGKSIYKIKLANGYTTASSREAEGIKVYGNNIYIFSAYASGTRADVGYYE